MKYIKTFEAHLSYDEIDLDSFLNRYIVGRYFESEKEAIDYLEKCLVDDSKKRNLGDFEIVDSDSGTLKPYRIYPVASEKENNRNEASKFIKKYGYVNGFYPMYAYIEHKHIEEIKRLGVKYTFKPLSDLKLTDLLNDYIGKVDGLEFTRVYDNPDAHMNHSTIVKSYFSNNVDKKESKKLYEGLMSYVNSFNGKMGSDYQVVKVVLNETRDSIRKGLLKKLNDDKPEDYNPNDEMSSKKEYEQISIVLERGSDEDEFLAMIEMESRDKPVMLSENR